MTRIVASEEALRLGISLKVDVRESRERKTRTRGRGVGGPSRLCPSLARSRGARPNRRGCLQASSHLESSSDTCCCLNRGRGFSPGRGFHWDGRNPRALGVRARYYGYDNCPVHTNSNILKTNFVFTRICLPFTRNRRFRS